MSRGIPSLYQIAHAVWNLIAVASRTVTVTTNSDKTGYSLAADQAVNVTKWNGTAVVNPNVGGTPLVDITHIGGSAVTHTSGKLTVQTVAGNVNGSVGSVVGAVGSVTGAVGSLTTNNDKSGYSLTAGSYSVRASSNQRGVIDPGDTQTTGTAAISSVTVTRARAAFNGLSGGQTTFGNVMLRIDLTNATTVTATRSGSLGNAPVNFEAVELF